MIIIIRVKQTTYSRNMINYIKFRQNKNEKIMDRM